MSKSYEQDKLGSRMKTYEAVPKNYLTLGTPKVIRLDMRAGHTFCKKLKRPFDDVFSECMVYATKELCEKVSGVVMGYTQSDEISLVVNDNTTKGGTNCFFDGNVEKMVSISASICTLAFNKKYFELVSAMEDSKNKKIYEEKLWSAQFDSRVFCLPNVMEVHNYVLWRQQDATKNSVRTVGYAYFSTKELDKKNTSEVQDMLMLQKGVNWNNFPTKYKRGCVVLKEVYEKDVQLPNGNMVKGVKRRRWVEAEIPILTQDLEFISKVYEKQLLVDGVLTPQDVVE